MAENYGSLEGVLDANETLEGEIDSHDEMSGEIQFSGGANGVRDVQVNNESVVDANKVAHIDLTPYAEKKDVYDKQTIDTALEGKADTDDIPTALSQLDNDDNYVQDADYHHTDNNFTDEDKAAIGNIPENITDLSDVAVDNIQNGQVLKWDATQEKFINANESGGGGGDVADVKVNGTSVVDPVTKEANIDLTDYAKTEDIPTDLADLSDDSTHRLVTDTEKSTWDAKSDFSGSYNDLTDKPDIPDAQIQSDWGQNDNTKVDYIKNKPTIPAAQVNSDWNANSGVAEILNKPTFGTAAAKDSTNAVTQSSTDLVESGAVWSAIDNLPEPMIFKGTLGTGGTITTLPTASSSNNGYTYKVIEDGTYDGKSAKVGDVFTSNATEWVLIPSGDETFTDTWRSVKVNGTELLGSSITTGAVNFKSGSNVTVSGSGNDIEISATDTTYSKATAQADGLMSKEDFSKLSGIETGAQVNTITGVKGNAESDYRIGNVNITPTNIGLGNVDNTSDSTKKTNFTGSIASGDTGFTTGGDVYTALGGKADKVSGATNGNLAGLNGQGNLTDSGWNGAKDTTSISGNPISISGLKANQLAVNPIITFEPIQAGSGTPSPVNQRPISGYDKVEALSCGKNLFDGTYSKTGTYLTTDGVEHSGTFGLTQYIPVKANTAYRFTNLSPGSTSAALCWYTKAKEYISGVQLNADFTAISPANACYAKGSVRDDMTNICINEGSSTITYEPYVNPTSISESLGQTVYGGTLDVRTGVLTVTHKAIDMGDLNYVYGGGRFNSTTAISDVGGNASWYYGDVIFSMYRNSGDSTDATAFIYSNVGTASDKILYVYDSRYTDATAFKAAVTGQKICYKLATPFTIQLTPYEISLLKDYAYLSTNGTSIALDYHNGELASLSDVSQLGETVNELGEYVNTINDNEYVNCNNCSTIASIFDTIRQGQALKSISYGVGYIGNSQNTNIKTLLGNPSIANYVDVYIKPIATVTYVQLAEVFAIGTVNVQTPIKRKYIWTNQSMASQSAWETINYMT